MRILFACLIFYLVYLIGERIFLDRWLRRIPLRIAVTGTRGKSSVARMLASVLREDGRNVIAKTTGSEAVILLPDGGEIELDRGITPSILEQKRLVREAAARKADCLVAEVMSLRAENHYIESRHILKPNIVVITNVRRDHTDIMGDTEEKIASVLSLAICPGATVLSPAQEVRPSFRAEAERCGARLIPVQPGASAKLLEYVPDPSAVMFSENLDLVCALADHLGVSRSNVAAGIGKARHDVGKLGVWRYRVDGSGRTCYVANAFAANDPESTLEILSRINDSVPEAARHVIGVLNLRGDRAARTLQWISALREGAAQKFARLLVVGPHARVVRRRVPNSELLSVGSAQELMKRICTDAPDSALVFGFGNIKGAGRLLAEHWAHVGEPVWDK